MTTGQQFTTIGMDETLPAGPPLVLPPLSLLSEARVLVDMQGAYARQQAALEKAASAQETLENYDRNGVVGDDDRPGQADSVEDVRKALLQQAEEAAFEAQTLVSQWARLQGWERGFQYLPELGNAEALSIFTPDTAVAISNPGQGALKQEGLNQDEFLWYDPFTAVALDARSMFGWPNTDFESRAQRAVRALTNHESWQVEQEFWTGASIPTNWHLSASPESPLTSPHRTLSVPFADPTPTPGTVLGTAVSLSQALASLDQAIAEGDGGTGMIHATPYMMQLWMKVFPFLRDNNGNVRTVNNNLLVPGYGYTGTGPDRAGRNLTDGVSVTSGGGTTFTSATAAFTSFDVGRPISDGGTNIKQQRSVTDASIVAGSTGLESATAAFTSADVGVAVVGFGLAPGTTILSVTSGSVVVLNQNAVQTVEGLSVTIGSATYIASVTNGTTVVLSQGAAAAATGIHFTVAGVGGRAGGSSVQWAYATDMCSRLQGDILTYPHDLRELSPLLPTRNVAPIRAERQHAIINNHLVRAAVVIDATLSN